MNVKAPGVVLLVLLVLPICSFAQDPQAYSWSVNPPNVASVSWTNQQIAMFLDTVTASAVASTVSDFKFIDLDGDGQLELLAGVDFSGRGYFNSLAVVRRIQNTFAVQQIDAVSVQSVSNMVRALDNSGKEELLVPKAFTPYLGGHRPQAKWTAIYGWDGRLFVDMSGQFVSYYQRAILAPLKQRLDDLRATAPNTVATDVAQMEYDKALRVTGQDPNAGLVQALQWVSNNDPIYRIFAGAIFADIGTSDALRALNNLITDQNTEVAIYSRSSLETVPDLHFKPVQIRIKATDDNKSSINQINLKSEGTLKVAILSSVSFNARAVVDRTSLTFGSNGTEQSLVRCNGESEDTRGEDVNGDGFSDLVCHFDLQSCSFQPGDASGTLKGKLKDGTAIKGMDSIIVVNSGESEDSKDGKKDK